MAILIGIITTIFIAIPAFVTSGNRAFFKIINDFKSKLPIMSKRASEDLLVLKGLTHIDTSNMVMRLSKSEIDSFHKSLELFNYNKILFRKKKTIKFSNNLQRHLNSKHWDKFNIAIIQNLLENDNFKRHIPYVFGSTLGEIIGF
jgi:hypothetical protein